MRYVIPVLVLLLALLPAPGAVAAAQEEIELEGISIIGNRELPKVLYIVPWKKAELGDLIDRPVPSLYDEVLEPVDREVFQRRLKYFRQLNDK